MSLDFQLLPPQFDALAMSKLCRHSQPQMVRLSFSSVPPPSILSGAGMMLRHMGLHDNGNKFETALFQHHQRQEGEEVLKWVEYWGGGRLLTSPTHFASGMCKTEKKRCDKLL